MAQLLHDASFVQQSGSVSRVSARSRSTVSLEGGSRGEVLIYEDVRVILSGGTVETLGAFGLSSEIQILGTGFEVNGVPVSFGVLDEGADRLTGTLESGDPLDVALEPLAPRGTIRLVEAPEPSSSALAMGSLLGVLAVASGRRRHVRRDAMPASARSNAHFRASASPHVR